MKLDFVNSADQYMILSRDFGCDLLEKVCSKTGSYVLLKNTIPTDNYLFTKQLKSLEVKIEFLKQWWKWAGSR